MLSNLTGIRGLAALWVVVFHYKDDILSGIPSSVGLAPAMEKGYLGVDLFFCLSGFILGHVYANELEGQGSSLTSFTKRFLVKRFARLYPVYFLSTLLAILIISVAKWQRHNFDHLPIEILEPINVMKNLALVQYWDNSYSINYPAWSVSAEFLAYLVFPILINLLLLKGKYLLLRACILIIIAASVHVYFVISSTVFDSSVLQVLTEFSMGLGTYFLVRNLKPNRNTIIVIRYILTSLLILAIFIVNSDPIIKIVIPVIFILICSANYFHNIPSKGLGRKCLVKLGLWSYSIYLTHGLVQYSLSGVGLPQRFNNIFLNILEIVSLFIIVVLIGSLTTRIIEIPSRKFLLTRLRNF